ncbi:MAG: DUF3995 domain-containing protein [Chloroflexi bacterium]|nr:DUF3995 domain-containing protein [Chloroflexota bacterium]
MSQVNSQAEPPRRRKIKWSAYAAAAWSFIFAALSFYWAMGGTAGAETLGVAFQDPEVVGDPSFVAVVWFSAFLKLLLGVFALLLVRTWVGHPSRRLILALAWGSGILLTLYGGALVIQHALMALRILDIPDSIGSLWAVGWHLFLWDPFWMMGCMLFLIAAWSATRRAD